MKTIDIALTYSSRVIDRPSPNSPACSRRYWADVVCDIVGSYGIPSDGNCKKRCLSVLVPDWIVPSAKWKWPMSVEGAYSNSGTDNLAFVACTKRVYVDVGPDKRCDIDDLFDRTLAGGLTLHYPTPEGKMATMPVYLA